MNPVVLVADDSRLARMVVSGILTRLRPDWTLVEAGNADQALAAVEQRAVDAALLDFNMPGANGLELASRIQARYPDLPIAIISANAQQAILDEAGALDVAFVEKPLSDERLAPFLLDAGRKLGCKAT